MNNVLLDKYFKLIHSDYNKLKFTYQDKNSIFIPLFSSSIDHCISINVLKDQNLTTSMYALIRPSIDNYLRAMWVKYCDEAGLLNEDLTDMHFHKRIERLIKEVFQERPDLEDDHSLKSVIEHTLNNMHDFTHGGIQSIARQYDEDSATLTNERDEEEISSIVKFSILISLLSYLEIIQENTASEPLNVEEINTLAQELIAL